MLGGYSLEEYYKENFAMITHGNFSLHDVETMILFERDIYAAQLIHYIQEKNKEAQ
ncbi:baseplate hub assembly catalyst [Vibrio phage D480]